MTLSKFEISYYNYTHYIIDKIFDDNLMKIKYLK